MIAGDPVLPGRKELRNCIKALNKTRVTAKENTAERALQNKEAFDGKTAFARDLDSLVLGQAVKLRNEKHTKGSPRWYGPFEISKVLDKNAYILVNHNRAEYPRPVNGNSLRPVSLRSLIVNKMWAALPAIALRENWAHAKVARDLLKKTNCLAKTKQPKKAAGKAAEPTIALPNNPPGRRLRLCHQVLGQPQLEGGDGCSRATGGQGYIPYTRPVCSPRVVTHARSRNLGPSGRFRHVQPQGLIHVLL